MSTETTVLALPTSDQIYLRINNQIASEMNVRPQQIAASVALMDEGATVPFIARYRKEVTGGLDDTQLRHIEERLLYLRELEERRGAILKSIHEQGKLTDALTTSIHAAVTKQALEATSSHQSDDCSRSRFRAFSKKFDGKP
jgi:uncharacterized protein